MSSEIPWTTLPLGAKAALEQQWMGVRDRALPCGAAVVEGDGVLAAGRNRAYDPATGNDPLERTRLAHAEFNALAGIETDRDWGALSLWSTQRPCAMCSAAIAFTGIGAVAYLAEDPSGAAQSDLAFEHVEAWPWSQVAEVLFLSTGAVLRGADDANLARARHRTPEIADVVERLAVTDRLGVAARQAKTIDEAAASLIVPLLER